MTRKTPEDLRSARWFARDDFRSFGQRSRMNQMGYSATDYAGKPFIGIVNTWSDLAQCHAHFKTRVEDVKRGVLQAGGFPVELPALSLSETNVKPTTMLYRNFLAMETEELIRSHPIDGVVLMGGCDKTTPGLLLGATSAGVPAIFTPAGPMLRGNWHGKVLGSGSDTIKYWEERRAGTISAKDLSEIEVGIARSYGVCMTMGTASTMTALADAIGMSLPGASSIPAADSNHIRMCADAGRRIVEMVWEDLTPSKIQTEAAYRNAIVVAMAMGCSTNAVIHIVAMARRAGHKIGLEDFDSASRVTPVIANIRPSGDKYLMEDFYYAGGLLGLMSRLKPFLDLSQINVSGESWAHSLEAAQVWDDDVIRPLDRPIYAEGALAVLKGNLAHQRLRHEAFRRRASPAQTFRPRARVRQLRRAEGVDRSRRPRRDPGSCPGAAQRWAVGRAGDARMGRAADPEEVVEAGGARHGAHFRRPHERHRLWRLHPARFAGVLYRGDARRGPDRRRHHARRPRPHAPSRRAGGRTRPPA